jgi:hypothetical protein
VLEESEVRVLLIKMSLPHNDTAVKKTRVELDQLVLETIPRAASVNVAFGDVLSAGRLKLRMDKLVKGRQQNREGRADAVVWGATKEQFNCWYRDRVKSVCTSSIDVLFGTTSVHAWAYFVWPQLWLKVCVNVLYEFGHTTPMIPRWHVFLHVLLMGTIVIIRQFEPYVSRIDSSFEVFVCLALTGCMHIGSLYDGVTELDAFFNISVSLLVGLPFFFLMILKSEDRRKVLGERHARLRAQNGGELPDTHALGSLPEEGCADDETRRERFCRRVCPCRKVSVKQRGGAKGIFRSVSFYDRQAKLEEAGSEAELQKMVDGHNERALAALERAQQEQTEALEQAHAQQQRDQAAELVAETMQTPVNANEARAKRAFGGGLLRRRQNKERAELCEAQAAAKAALETEASSLLRQAGVDVVRHARNKMKAMRKFRRRPGRAFLPGVHGNEVTPTSNATPPELLAELGIDAAIEKLREMGLITSVGWCALATLAQPAAFLCFSFATKRRRECRLRGAWASFDEVRSHLGQHTLAPWTACAFADPLTASWTPLER